MVLKRVLLIVAACASVMASRVDAHHSPTAFDMGRVVVDVLVIDMTLFSDHRSPYTSGVPSGAGKHVVERYAFSEDRR